MEEATVNRERQRTAETILGRLNGTTGTTALQALQHGWREEFKSDNAGTRCWKGKVRLCQSCMSF